MSICVHCPDGHPVMLDESRLGSVIACPRCFATFHAEVDDDLAHYARAEKGRARPSRDDDDDDEEDDDEDEKPAKKKPKPKPARRRQEEEDDDDEEDDEEDEDDDDEEEEDEDEVEDDEPTGPLTKKQRNLQKVQLGLSLISWGIVCFAVVPLANLFGGALTWIGVQIFLEMPWLAYGFAGLFGICELGVDALIIIGVILGFWAPKKSEVKSSIIGVLLFSALMIFFIVIGILGFTNVVTNEHDVGMNLGRMCFGLAGLCKIVFLLTTMVYLKKVASFFKDSLLASEPINLLIEFLVWTVVPSILLGAIFRWIDVRHLDGFSYIIVAGYDLFLLFATLRAGFVLRRWVNCVNQIAALVGRTIKDM